LDSPLFIYLLLSLLLLLCPFIIGACGRNSKTSPCLCPAGYSGDRCEEPNQIPNTSSTGTGQMFLPDNVGFPSTTNTTTSTTTTTAGTTTCSLACQRGKCEFGGMISHPDGWTPPSATMHCQCDAGYGGPYCEKLAADCGIHKCYNGATCVTDVETNLLHCDCTMATTDQVYYAGQFCQFESTDYCGEHPEAGDLFCVNHGTCRTDAAYSGCDCPAGFDGFACEFQIGQGGNGGGTEDYSVCDLPCQNGGECRKGGQYTTRDSDELVLQHCVCPPLFGGDLCEIPTSTTATTPETLMESKSIDNSSPIDCGVGRHSCANSAKCVAYGDEQLCDCGTGRLATFFEGQNCLHPTHDICTVGTAASDAITYRQVVPTQQLSYCVNGGRCKAAVNDNEP
jgi:hypothetical protein